MTRDSNPGAGCQSAKSCTLRHDAYVQAVGQMFGWLEQGVHPLLDEMDAVRGAGGEMMLHLMDPVWHGRLAFHSEIECVSA